MQPWTGRRAAAAASSGPARPRAECRPGGFRGRRRPARGLWVARPAGRAGVGVCCGGRPREHPAGRVHTGVTRSRDQVAACGHHAGTVRRTPWMLGCGIGLLALGVLIDSRPWNWPWQSVWSILIAHIALIGFGVPAISLLTVVAVSRRRTRAAKATLAEPAPGPKWHWLLSYPGVATVGATVAIVGVAALVIMLKVAGSATGSDRPTLQIDAIKYGLGLFAAGGAAAALLLGVRRQQHSEHAQAHTELDAAERRVTDLYTKAVEQLGHAEAAVRLGGLYALERVAQYNVRQRQPIINVLCAYLRMPYTPPVDEPTAGKSSDPTTPAELPLNPTKPAPAGGRDPHQELQVRLTAQRWPRPQGSIQQGDLHRRRAIRRGDLLRRRVVRRGDLHRPRGVRRGDLHRRHMVRELPGHFARRPQ